MIIVAWEINGTRYGAEAANMGEAFDMVKQSLTGENNKDGKLKADVYMGVSKGHDIT